MKPAAAVLAVACGAVLAAQSAVTMNEEPHHNRLTYIRNMRVFEVNVAPGEVTLDHIHDHDAATIVLGPAMTRTRIAGQDWTAPRDRTLAATEINMYTGATIVHRLENVGSTPYRIFSVENLRDAGWSNPKPVEAPGTKLLQQSRSFAIYDVNLTAAEPRTMHVHDNPTFVTVMSGVVSVQGGGGEAEFQLEKLGRWFPSSGADQPHTLTLVGTGDAHVIEVEAR
jgi:quercetin dioxygenase-like cupin family protein